MVDIYKEEMEPSDIVTKIIDSSLIEEEINKIIINYYNSSKNNLDIARFAHEINLLHPFSDGNIRTIVFLLVNKLLIDEGRPPIVFMDPNIFDGFSTVQLVLFIDEEIKLSVKFCQDLNDSFSFKSTATKRNQLGK